MGLQNPVHQFDSGRRLPIRASDMGRFLAQVAVGPSGADLYRRATRRCSGKTESYAVGVGGRGEETPGEMQWLVRCLRTGNEVNAFGELPQVESGRAHRCVATACEEEARGGERDEEEQNPADEDA